MIGCPVYTAFTENNEIDYNKINEQYQLICKKGFDCVLIGGTTGEWTELTIDERIRLIEVWSNICVTKKIIVNVSDVCLKNVHQLINACKENRIWSILILGKQISHTDNLIKYLKKATVNYDFMYYYYPSIYGYKNININDMFLKLPNMIGIKIVDEIIPEIEKEYIQNKLIFVSCNHIRNDNHWTCTFVEEFLVDFIGKKEYTNKNNLLQENRKEKGRIIIEEIYGIKLGPSRLYDNIIDDKIKKELISSYKLV